MAKSKVQEEKPITTNDIKVKEPAIRPSTPLITSNTPGIATVSKKKIVDPPRRPGRKDSFSGMITTGNIEQHQSRREQELQDEANRKPLGETKNG